VVEAADGHLSPSYSPENTPAGHDNPLAVDATADLAALRDGLRIGAWLARRRDEPNLAELWTSARGALPDYRVADDGCLAEWASETPEHLAHRHASQLHGLWYEADEAFSEGPLRDAALATVRSKTAWRAEAPFGPPGHQEMAFGLSSIALAAANLGDAGSAYQCAIWLARDHFTRGLVSTHDAGAIFNLDASGALPAVVAAMLVRSSRSSIHLLPALPTPWEAGSITGLTARGGVIIHSLSWSPTDVSIDLELRPEAAWLRPPYTRIRLPKPGRIRTTPHVLQLNPTSIGIGTDAPRTTIIIDYPKPTASAP
jgi:hypothetical protein